MTAVRPPRGGTAGITEAAGTTGTHPAATGIAREAGTSATAWPTTPRDDLGLEIDAAPRLRERLVRLLDEPAGSPPGSATIASAGVAAPALDPIALFAAAIEAGLEVAVWLRPSEGTALVGIGRAWAVEAEGPTRFQDAETAFRDLIAGARIDRSLPAGASFDPGDGGVASPSRAASSTGAATLPATGRGRGPLLIGGLGFRGRRPDPEDPWAPFGPSSMVLPSLLLSATPAGTSLTGSVVAGEPGRRESHLLERLWDRLVVRARTLEPGRAGMVARPVFAPLTTVAEQPGRDSWRRLVGMYAGAVGRGRIDKVVLARRVDVRSPVEFDVPNALRRLAASAPESTIYAFRRAGRTFLGATPERLVRTEGRAFRTAAVAGTIRRGADPAEDAVLGDELRTSDKNREEHRIVVASISQLLAPIAETLEVDPQPSLMVLRFAQHLVTELAGTLPEGHGLLSVAAVLHPTPAVGGEPRDVALAMVDENEGFDRGWYAGPIGWLGADGDGELCVALRCGIVERTRASLFAGCGIVADSDPDQEWEESRIKLRAVISALGMPGDQP